MIRNLILLQLSGGGSVENVAKAVAEHVGTTKPLYSPGGVLRELKEALDDEWTYDEDAFNRAFMELIEAGCIMTEGSTCSLTPRGKERLRDSKLLRLVTDQMNDHCSAK